MELRPCFPSPRGGKGATGKGWKDTQGAGRGVLWHHEYLGSRHALPVPAPLPPLFISPSSTVLSKNRRFQQHRIPSCNFYQRLLWPWGTTSSSHHITVTLLFLPLLRDSIYDYYQITDLNCLFAYLDPSLHSHLFSIFSLLCSNLKCVPNACAKTPDLNPLTLLGNNSLIRVKFPLACMWWIRSVLFQNTVQEKQLILSGELPQPH